MFNTTLSTVLKLQSHHEVIDFFIVLVFLLLTLNIFHTFVFLCVSFVDFEKVNVSWESILFISELAFIWLLSKE